MNITQLLQNPFIERSQGLDKQTFNERFGYPSQPVIISDMTDNWEAKQKWNFEFFKNRFGTLTGNAERTHNGKKESAAFTIADYIDYMTSTDDDSPFYLRNTQFHLGTELKEDYQVPEYFDCWYANSTQGKARYALSWIFMGAANTFSKLHLDIWDSSAWNAVLSGKKFWIFYDPSQSEYLYDGQVNPFEPDFEKFPEFVHARPVVCLQSAGDVVFTPSGWWHAVLNVEAGISITENFINETNYEAVIESFAKQGKPQACRDIQALADRYGKFEMV